MKEIHLSKLSETSYVISTNNPNGFFIRTSPTNVSPLAYEAEMQFKNTQTSQLVEIETI